MDVSALPYAYYFLVDFVLFLVCLVFWFRQRRGVLAFALGWLGVAAIRYFLIVASAGENSWLERESVITLIRALVYVEATLKASTLVPFLRENADMSALKPGVIKPFVVIDKSDNAAD